MEHRPNRRSIHARIDDSLYRRARVEAALRDMPVGRLIEAALRGELDRNGTTERPQLSAEGK